ncbi:hypothetical protein PWEIH_14856 [Listeria weihenstephanensis FSL R9-0317]|uniref:Uncharacterized protein n=1 Tax=Listeria weihenstephanensis TaxID=1006155 RepID=A0A1S7FVW1_9LIST|nr:hypothetical protein [Listeria weihenstephanensis]AQY51475.1 hypothetical protein UE46_10790 [Listeria weihenstephanensis]EUJ35833.1 hypothetical protein PWEIH_14856 [Listeria weihenstephanensis FSL R9-0317]
MDRDDVLELAKNINHEYETGIWSEINSFFGYREDVAGFDLVFNRDGDFFQLDVRMKSFSHHSADDLFLALVRFIEYKEATFYVQERTENMTIFLMLSCMHGKKGFLLDLKFG